MPSYIYLPSTYPDFSGEMSKGKRGFNLLAMALEITLYMMLHRAISRNLCGVLDSSSFGISAMKVELRDGNSQ